MKNISMSNLPNISISENTCIENCLKNCTAYPNLENLDSKKTKIKKTNLKKELNLSTTDWDLSFYWNMKKNYRALWAYMFTTR